MTIRLKGANKKEFNFALFFFVVEKWGGGGGGGGVLEKDRNEYILICDKERGPNIFEITYQLRMLYTAISFLSLERNLENSPHMEIANAKFLTSEVFVFKIYQYCSKILRSIEVY